MPKDQPISVRCPTCNGRLRIKDARLRGQIVHCPRCQGLVLVQDDQEQLQVVVNESADSQADTRDAIEPRDVSVQPEFDVTDERRSANAPAPVPPPVAWEGPKTQHRRQIILVSLIAVVSLLAAGVLFWLFVTAMTPKAAPIAVRPDVAPAPPPTELADDPQPPPQEPVVVAEPNRSDTPNELVPAEEMPPSAPDAPKTKTPDSEIAHADSEQAQATSVPQLLDLPPGLSQFVPTLSDRGPMVSPELSLPALLTAEELSLKLNLPVASDSRLHPPPAALPNFQKGLEKKLVGFRAGSDSFVELCGVLSQLSGIPIWFDQAMLDTAQIDLQQPIKIKQASNTVGEALQSIVSATGCIFREEPNGMICIRVEDAVLMKHLTPAIHIDDFDANDTTMLEVVRKLVPPLRGEESGVAAKLVIDQASRQWVPEGEVGVGQFWIAALSMEALRASRKMPLRLRREMTARWLVLEQPELPKPIGESTTRLANDTALPIVEWIGRLAKEQDAIALIQWSEAWAHGLTPAQTRLPYLRRNSAANVLSQMLDNFDLRVYQDGPKVWWVGSEDAYQSRLTVAALEIPERLRNRPADLLSALAQSLKTTTDELPAIVDPKSGRLLLRMTRQLVSQVAANLQPK